MWWWSATQADRPRLAGLQAMGENVAAAAAEFCCVLASPAAAAPLSAPGVFVDFLGLRLVRPIARVLRVKNRVARMKRDANRTGRRTQSIGATQGLCAIVTAAAALWLQQTCVCLAHGPGWHWPAHMVAGGTSRLPLCSCFLVEAIVAVFECLVSRHGCTQVSST